MIRVDPPPLSMTLGVGFQEPDFEALQPVLEELLGVPLGWASDQERGGAYLRYDAAQSIRAGVSEVRVTVNQVPGIGAAAPTRPDLQVVASIGFEGTNVLELGRLAAAVQETWGETAGLLRCAVCAPSPGAAGSVLWRGRLDWIEPPTSDTPPPPPRPEWAQTLLCHVTFGLGGGPVEESVAALRTALAVDLEQRENRDLGGLTFEHDGLLVRANQPRKGDWLYPDRREHVWLLDATSLGASMVDPGRAAAAIERRCGEAVQLVGYRIFGDLARDRVPRLLEREFATAAEARSIWPRR